MQLIYRGAEAELWKTDYLGLPAVEKRRVSKSYRIKEIDERLRGERLKTEARMMMDARSIVSTPRIYDVDPGRHTITLEFVEGRKVKDLFLAGKDVEKTSRLIGKSVAALHRNGIIHGDLTTSNMLLRKNRIWFIDFGLGFRSEETESKAVDLLVFKRMLKSTHWRHFDRIWRSFLAGYGAKNDAVRRLGAVEKRARYMERVG
jgi:Kae1-associated kinase Bud32